MKNKKDCWVFECRSCGHLVFIKKDKDLNRLLSLSCPGCQCNDKRNWILIGEGESRTFN